MRNFFRDEPEALHKCRLDVPIGDFVTLLVTGSEASEISAAKRVTSIRTVDEIMEQLTRRSRF